MAALAQGPLCPGCATPAGSVVVVTGGGLPPPPRREPRPGAFAVCSACGEVAVFAGGPFGLYLRAATLEELSWFAADPIAAKVAAAVLRHRAAGGA